MTDPRIGLIWAEARGGVIGAAGGMPWDVPEDLAHFSRTTRGGVVVMGRRTWESFPDKYRPLPGRRNIVVTRSEQWHEPGAERAGSLDAALEMAATALPAENSTVWVIGGGAIFAEIIGRANLLVVTELDVEVEGDTFAPSREGFAVAQIEPNEGWAVSRTGTRYRILTLVRP